MGDSRKVKRAVVMTRDSAATVLAGISEGLKKGEVLLDGKDGKIVMTPGAELKLRIKARGAQPDGPKGGKGSVMVKMTWERTRTLRDKASADAAKGAKKA